MLQQPDQRREIIFKGQLQQKITKRTGTLLRKKRAIYEDELWVLLCVHDSGNGGIPHLEWYADLRSAYQHNPLCVQDLLDCQYVNVAIGEERCIVIGFVDKNRPVLELSAPSVEERRQWVAKLTETLRRLNCLKDDEFEDGITACSPRAENEYVALNALDESPSKARVEQPHQPMPTNNEMGPYVPVTPILQQMSAAAQKLSLTDTIPMHSSPPSTSTSPPFPSPRVALQASASMPNNPKALPRQQASKPINISSFKQTSSMTKHSQISPNSTIGEDEEFDGTLPPPLPPRKAGPSPTPSCALLIDFVPTLTFAISAINRLFPINAAQKVKLMQKLFENLDGDPCEQSVEEGEGYSRLERFYFDPTQRRCRHFIYKGSRGNANNFLSAADCEYVCLTSLRSNPCPHGQPLVDDANEPLVCGNSDTENPAASSGCPSGFWCHVGSSPETTNCCPYQHGEKRACEFPLDLGTGSERLDRWYYDGTAQA